MQIHAERAQPDEEGSFTGLMLFYNCQHVAWRLTQTAGQMASLTLSGAQLFYCTSYALLRRGIVSKLEPDTTILPTGAAQAFFQIMPSIARWLAADYGNAVSLLEQPTPLQRWRMVGGWLRQSPQLHQELARRTGISWALDPAWPTMWDRFWQQTEQEYAARMLFYLSPLRLLVVPVAHPGASDKHALALLRKRLADDRSTRGWTIPPAEIYLYEEALADWLLRPLLAGSWFARLAQMLQQAQAAQHSGNHATSPADLSQKEIE